MNLNDTLRMKIISLGMALLTILSFLALPAANIISLPENWYVPMIFAAFVVVLQAIIDVSKTEAEIEQKLAQSKFTITRVYRDHEQVVTDAVQTLRSTSDEVKLLRARNHPPRRYQASYPYDFSEELEKWCNRNPNTRLTRLITVPNENVKEWVSDQTHLPEEHANYHIRVIERDVELDINNAIFGDEELYLTIELEEPESTRGLYIRSQGAVDIHEERFDTLWAKAIPIDEYVK